MSTETILILGGSFAGISAAHYALKHTIPQLPKKEDVTYNVTLVNPSKDLFWRFAAPRAIVSKQMMPGDQIFYPIEPAFTYAFPKFKFVQGTATRIDTAGQSVSVETVDGEQQSIPYAALIIATGFSTPSPLFTQATDRAALEALYDAFQEGLKTAKTVIIGGGGPVGVETAGEVAEILNGRPGFMGAAPKNPKAQVTLVCADKKMLPVLREPIGKTAEGFLQKLGCSVMYNTCVVSTTKASEEAGAKTQVELSTGETLEADIYIDATGIKPNTSFLPKEWLDNRKGGLQRQDAARRARVGRPARLRRRRRGLVHARRRHGSQSRGARRHDQPQARPDHAPCRDRVCGRPALRAESEGAADLPDWHAEGCRRFQWLQGPEPDGVDDQGEGLFDLAVGAGHDSRRSVEEGD